MKKIGIITSTRAEYGLLRPLIEKFTKDEDTNVQLIVTGTHLSEKYGNTYKEIQKDGYSIASKVNILSDDNTDIGIIRTMSNTLREMSVCFDNLKPDVLVILGDRYEIFSAVSAAYVMKIPIVHIHGGETTEGAYDEAFRHCITKMSYLHFTATEEYRRRVIQLGESPDRVFSVGSLGAENIKNIRLISKTQLEKEINFKLDGDVALCTFHPVTLENNTAGEQFGELLKAFDDNRNLKIVFTKANADTCGDNINDMIDCYVKDNKRSIAFDSMGTVKYLSAMKLSSVVIGNSSSGIAEAPSFKVPTVNIGDRQKGRIFAKSVISCEAAQNEISLAIKKALSKEFRNYIEDTINPYQGNDTSSTMVKIIKDFIDDKVDLKKTFYDVNGGYDV